MIYHGFFFYYYYKKKIMASLQDHGVLMCGLMVDVSFGIRRVVGDECLTLDMMLF